MKRHSLIGLTLVAGMMLATVGCSGSQGRTSTKDALQVAFLGTFSGVTSSGNATMKDAVEAWAEEVNANGGLDGHHVDLIVKDVAGPTGTNVNVAKSVIAQKVDAILDVDEGSTQWLNLAEQAKIPVITSSSFAQVVYKSVFPVFGDSPAQTYMIASAAKMIGPKMAIGYASEAQSAAEYAAQVKSFGKNVGVSVVVSAELSSSQPDYTAFCQLLKTSGVNEYFLALSTATAQKVTNQCYQQGVRLPQVLLGYQTSPALVKSAAYQGSIAQDLTAPFFDTSVPAVAAYRSAMKKYAPSVLGTDKDSSAGTMGWSLAEMLSYAVKHGGGITSADIFKGLYTAKNETLGGLIAPVTYVEGKNTSIGCAFVWAIRSQDYTLTTNGIKPVCAPAGLVASADAEIAKSLDQ